MWRLSSLTLSVLVVAGLALAAPAQATDEEDYTFYTTMENDGFHMSDPPLLRGRAQAICTAIGNGTPPRIVMTRVMNIGYDLDQMSILVASAISAYCPEFIPLVKPQDEHAI